MIDNITWQVLGRKMGQDVVYMLEPSLPSEDDAHYLATEYRLAMGSDWVINASASTEGEIHE